MPNPSHELVPHMKHMWPISIVNWPPKRQLANVGNGWAHMVVAVVCVLLDSCSRLAWARARVSLDTLKTEKRQQLLNCKRRGCGESTVADVMCETCRCHAGPRESFPTCYNQNEDHEGKPGKETTEEHLCFFSEAATPAFLCTRGLLFFSLRYFGWYLIQPQ